MKRTPFAIYFVFFALIAAFWLLSNPRPPRLPEAAHPPAQPHREASSFTPDSDEMRRMIFLLQYIGNDYARAVQNGAILDSLEFSEMQNFSRTLLQSYRTKAKDHALTRHGLESLVEYIRVKADRAVIRSLSARLVGQLTQEAGLLLFPLTTPDLESGRQLFRENCVACHGENGAGNGPAADTLNPKPRDLRARAYLDFVTPFHLYQAITLGVAGTAMPEFGEAFSSEQSWSLAFYVMTLRQGFRPQPAKHDLNLSLQQLAVQTNVELQRSLARDAQSRTLTPEQMSRAIDYYRSRLPKFSLTEHVKITKAGWRKSLACYQGGDFAQAHADLMDAYMQGFEPIEGQLAEQVSAQIERLVIEYRACLEAKCAYEQAAARLEEMLKLLDEVLENPAMLRK